MLRWLLGQEITHDEAIRIATQFVFAEWQTYTADWPADEAEWPYDPPATSPGMHYWYVHFPRTLDEGVICSSSRGIEVWVHKRTGAADRLENILPC
jgi:hypothetical protein